MITDKQIIETLKNIKKYCESNNKNSCSSCKFKKENRFGYSCQLCDLSFEISQSPSHWNINDIERIIKQ